MTRSIGRNQQHHLVAMAVGFCYLLLRYAFGGDHVPKQRLNPVPEPLTSRPLADAVRHLQGRGLGGIADAGD